jgi:hypothetical protein
MKAPIRMCASWCGGGCTKAQHDRALRWAKALARTLGRGWRPVVTENLGWYASAVSSCGRLKVHVDNQSDRVLGYTAFLGPRGPGGRWAASARYPLAAVRAVIENARAELAAIGAMLEGL